MDSFLEVSFMPWVFLGSILWTFEEMSFSSKPLPLPWVNNDAETRELSAIYLPPFYCFHKGG